MSATGQVRELSVKSVPEPAALASDHQTRAVERLTRASVLVVLILVPAMAAATFASTVGSAPAVLLAVLALCFLTFLVATVDLARWALACLREQHPVQDLDRRRVGWCAASALAVLVLAWWVDGVRAAPLSALVLAAGWGALAPALRAAPAAAGAAGIVAAHAVVTGLATGIPSLAAVTVIVPSLFSAALLVAATWYSGLILRMVFDLNAARRDAASAAVVEDRLRIARDLHDVFGRTLTAVALKSELAAELASREGAPSAAQQMLEVCAVVDDAGAQMRRVVGGYRQPELSVEIDGARALLAAVGVDFEVEGNLDRVPQSARAVLAWVLREAVTNVLRHADATRLHLHIRDGQRVRIEVRNDGARLPQLHRGARPGTGITGMGERLATVGGSVHAAREGDDFVLRIEVPS